VRALPTHRLDLMYFQGEVHERFVRVGLISARQASHLHRCGGGSESGCGQGIRLHTITLRLQVGTAASTWLCVTPPKIFSIAVAGTLYSPMEPSAVGPARCALRPSHTHTAFRPCALATV
jgi:hypothetical protein